MAELNPEMLEKIIDIGREMAENLNLEPLLQYAMGVAIDLAGAEYGYLVLIEENDQLNFRVCRDKDGNLLDEPDGQISHTIFSQVISSQEPLIIADAIVDPKFKSAESVLALQLRSVMCVPLISRERVLGAIYVENRSKTSLFDETSLRPLEYLAAQAAVTIENVLLYEELEARVENRTKELASANDRLQILAITDPLTGIYNRRHFFSLAHQAFHQAERYQHDLSVVMIDIDHFKIVNDRFGHAVGDMVLLEFSKILQENIRDADFVARYGGEEFVILMPETPLASAATTAQRLCDIVNRHHFDFDEDQIQITVSLGLASLPSSKDNGIDSLDNLINYADQALYRAKNAGRNCVAVWN
jgi:diguanylate cyclase (GGDEF)-like protein